jgi:F-type H+-transporting ATPase subunit b
MSRAQRIAGWGALGIGAVLAWAGVAAAAGGGGGGVDPAKITDFTWRSFNFVVFAGILVYLLAKKVKVKDFFAARAQDIANSLDDLESRKAAAAEALAEAEANLAQVAGEREKIIKQYLAEGEMEKAKIVEKAEMVAARIKEMAAMSIEQETKKAVQELKQEIADLSGKMAEDLLKQKVTFADHQQLVEEYLKKVVEAH